MEAAITAATSRPSRASVVRTWIGTSRGENGKTRVTFVWEPILRPPGERNAGDEPARVSLIAASPDGSPYFRGKIEGAAAGSSAAGGAAAAATAPKAPARVAFEAAPGKMQLRVSVEGTGSQVLDTEIREITVPDLTGGQTLLGTPELFRARTAREFQVLKADADPVTLATREFSRTDRLVVRVPAYGTGGTPALKIHLLNRSGSAMSELTPTPSPKAGEQQVDLALAGLAPGEYVLEIKAADGDATELIGFRVIG